MKEKKRKSFLNVFIWPLLRRGCPLNEQNIVEETFRPFSGGSVWSQNGIVCIQCVLCYTP